MPLSYGISGAYIWGRSWIGRPYSKLQNGREFSKFTCVRLCVHKHPKMEGNDASPPSSSTTSYQSRWCRNSTSRPLAREHGNRWSSKAGFKRHCLPFLGAYVHKGAHKWISKILSYFVVCCNVDGRNDAEIQ